MESQGKLYAVIAHVFFSDLMVMAQIGGRGVCVPSGHILPGETIDAAVVRETYEETGAKLHSQRRYLIGCYRVTPRSGERAGEAVFAPVYIAEATSFHKIPEGSESQGFILLPPEDVADQYYTWDPLLEAEFAYVLEQRAELLTPGFPIPSD